MTIKNLGPRNNPKLEKLQHILAELTDVDPEFPLSWALVFIEIALEEGQALKDVADKTGMSMSVMSRTIGALSNARRMGKPYGLINVRFAKDDRRRKELFLSPKGKKLIETLKKKV